MKFSQSFVNSLLLAGLAAAAPSFENRFSPLRSNNSNDQDGGRTSNNWAGAVLDGHGLTKVVGVFTVPEVSIPRGGNANTQYGASAWVGIDGDSCQSGLLQTGVSFYVTGDNVEYQAWYEWFPDLSYPYENIDISAGDEIRVTVVATSTSSGTTTLENLTTGVKRSHTFTDDSNSLCFSTAEWIVEDFDDAYNNQLPFADYGSVKFTDAYAYTASQTYGINDAEVLDMNNGVSNNVILSSTTIDGDHELTVTREYP